jgi:hypothetical protein
MYKKVKDFNNGEELPIIQRLSDDCFIPFDLGNTDYRKFKKGLTEGVELQDAEGNTMTVEEVAEFVTTLP